MIENPVVIQAEQLTQKIYEEVSALQGLCTKADGITLKLELEYKLSSAACPTQSTEAVSEFLYYSGDQLIGYLGICNFGGDTLEVNGMVHPDFRRQGVFTQLFTLVKAEWLRRNLPKILLLSDRNSPSGQGFINGTGASLEHSEYEMFLTGDIKENAVPKHVTLRKADNTDAREIARQNAVYFDSEIRDEDIVLPEQEEKRGSTIFIAEAENKAVGKVHLEIRNGIGGIYGLGVLPEHRGKGYGRELLLLAVEKLKEMGAQQLMLQVSVSNDRALNLYKSCGFEETSVMDYYELHKK